MPLPHVVMLLYRAVYQMEPGTRKRLPGMARREFSGESDWLRWLLMQRRYYGGEAKEYHSG